MFGGLKIKQDVSGLKALRFFLGRIFLIYLASQRLLGRYVGVPRATLCESCAAGTASSQRGATTKALHGGGWIFFRFNQLTILFTPNSRKFFFQLHFFQLQKTTFFIHNRFRVHGWTLRSAVPLLDTDSHSVFHWGTKARPSLSEPPRCTMNPLTYHIIT